MKKQPVQARRTEILETTCQVVIERGFAGTRISDVAKRLDVSTSLIHYHFDSKEQLLAEAFSHFATKDLAEMAADVEGEPTALAQLDRVIRDNVPEGSDDVEWMLWIDAWGEALRNPLMKRISQELDEQSVELLERVIRRGVDAGEFRCADPAGAAMRLTGLIDGLAVQFAAHTGVLSREQLLHHARWTAAEEVGVPVSAFDAAMSGPDGATSTPTPATELALRRLVDTQSDAVQRRDAAAWVATWTDDGTWEGAGGVHSGHDALLEAFEAWVSDYDWLVQVAPTALFEVDERAGAGTGRVTVHERFRAGGVTGSRLGVYHDRYARTPAGWRFVERRLELVEGA